jgi:hypothetical protein
MKDFLKLTRSSHLFRPNGALRLVDNDVKLNDEFKCADEFDVVIKLFSFISFFPCSKACKFSHKPHRQSPL